MHPITQKQFFEGSIHLVFAVVVAQGFTIAGQVFIPIQKLYSYDGIVHALALVFAYFFVMSGWYGFFKSVRLFQHKKISKSTLARYGCAIFNTFILYYMISITAMSDGIDYATVFWLIPLYFSIIIIVHLIKSVESGVHIRKGVHKKLKQTILMTFLFLAIFIFQAWLFGFLVVNVPNLKWDEHIAWNPIFIVSSFIISGMYRWKMWKEKWVMPRRSAE